MKVSILDSKSIQGRSWFLGKMSLWDYLVSVSQKNFEFEIQRGIVKNKYLEFAEATLEKLKLDYPCKQQNLFNSVNYSLLASGKRIRPIILLAACEMAGGNIEDAANFAAGLEMIHNSSLIHRHYLK